ncbi:hypothetical protein H5410_015260 [Solanum commersonii]|uniref:F-box domain-containing protein n=1 Tax=Solanum commersonii TaxID=4109 RepID=A0A9J5ZTW4_SOLCO|nr:hypothetical protein H5410_015260 [Solanum commersonii]
MIPMRRIPTLPQELIVEIFQWFPIMSLMRFRCISKFFDVLVLDSDITHVHHLHSMTRDGETKFLMGKAEDLYIVDLNEEGYTSRWNFDCHDQYFNGPCVNGSYCIWKHDKEPVRIFNPNFTRVHHLRYMTRDGGTKFLMGKAEDQYVGKIALLDCWGCFTGQNDLWALENSEKEEWKSNGIHIPPQWKDVEDISKPEYCPPQGFYDFRDGEIIFIAMKNSILFCNFYDVETNSWRYLKIHGTPTEDGINVINFYVESLYSC